MLLLNIVSCQANKTCYKKKKTNHSLNRPINSNLPHPYPPGMGSGKFETDFPLVLEEFVRGFFCGLGSKMKFGSFLWTKFGLCERMAHSKRLQNSF